MPFRPLSKATIIADIRHVARHLNHSPSSVEYKHLGSFDVRTVQRKFSKSWKQIINEAGLQYVVRTSSRVPSMEELKKDLIRVAFRLGHPPTRFEYEAEGTFGSEIVKRRSGLTRWGDAVAFIAGLDGQEIKRRQMSHYRTTEEWLHRINCLSIRLGHAPTTAEANKAGISSHEICTRIGGNWLQVLKAAGVDVRKRSKAAKMRSTVTEVLIHDVVKVSRELGRPAKAREYNEQGRFRASTVCSRMGGWSSVKRIVRERIRPDYSLAKPLSR